MKFWKKLKYWQKWSAVGLIIYSLYFLIIFSWNELYHIPFAIRSFLVIPLIPMFYLSISMCGFEGGGKGILCGNFWSEFLLYFVLFMILGYSIGALIGFLIQKFKTRKK